MSVELQGPGVELEVDAGLPDYNESMAKDPPAPDYPGSESGSVKSALVQGVNTASQYGSQLVAGEGALLDVNVEGGDAPPSYTSIYGQIKDAKQNSEGNLDFAKVVFGILIGSVVGLICIGLSGAFPIVQLVIGVKYLDMCPIQSLIPIWLIVSGACGIVQVILSMCKSIATRKNSDGSQSGGGCCQMLLNLIHLAATGWFIAGNIWVYKIKDTVSYDPTNSTNMTQYYNGTEVESLYCDKTCYLFAFWSITVAYIGLAVCLVICCIACLCMCVIAGTSN